MKKKTCYISLPIEGRDIDEVKKEIEKHKAHLREKGFIPISPFDIEEDSTTTHEQNMGEDFKPIPKCDAIYIAPSPGVSRICHAEFDIETRKWHFIRKHT